MIAKQDKKDWTMMRVKKELKNRFKIAAMQRQMNMETLLERVLEEYLIMIK
jgi:predicted HicB family RNase H-like nuclease